MPKHQPLPLNDLKSLRRAIRSAEAIHRERLSKLDRVALWATDNVGSMGFFLILTAWTAVWVAWNIVMPRSWQFDPYPAFVAWLFVSNVIQLLLLPLLMVGQNLLGRHAEARAEAEFELDVKAEREIETVLQHLENQNEVLERLEERLERLEKRG